MKLLICLLVLASIIYANAEECIKIECDSSNYESYVDCQRAKRAKRNVCDYDCEGGDCGDECNTCDCDECSGFSTSSCCSNCCSATRCRTTSCCQRTCRVACRDTSCRTSCKKSCYKGLKKDTSSSTVNSQTKNNVTLENDNKHNITTIIHLNNIINTTNLIDVPITLNNTNVNNITVLSEEDTIHTTNMQPNQPVQPMQPVTPSCCTLVGPRQCTPTDKFPFANCFHYRSNTCSDICKANIMHVQPKQVCSSVPFQPPQCKQQLAYIPQPDPKCTYQSTWPYVSCGIQQNTNCEGCYEHYFDESRKNHLSCNPSCYDDGYGVGPYYRQGPVYRPGYSHIPSCFQTNTCGFDGTGIYGGLGGLGGLGLGTGFPSYGSPLSYGFPSTPFYGTYPSSSYLGGSFFGNSSWSPIEPYGDGDNLLLGIPGTSEITDSNDSIIFAIQDNVNAPDPVQPFFGIETNPAQLENLKKIFNKRSVKVEEKIQPPGLINVGPSYSYTGYSPIVPPLKPIFKLQKDPEIKVDVEKTSDAEIIITERHRKHHHHTPPQVRNNAD